MRLSASLTVVGALLLMSGVLIALVGEARRLNSPQDGQTFVRAGEILAAAGLACGLAVMVAVAVGAFRRRPAGLRAARRGRAAQSGRASEWDGFAQVEQAAGWGGFDPVEQAAAGWDDSAQVEQAAAEWDEFAQVSQAAHRRPAEQERITADQAGADEREPAGRREHVTPPRGDDAAAEEWLSQFRPAHAASTAEPEPEPQPGYERVQERRVTAYADDDWQPEEVPADYAARWPEPAFAQDAAVVDLRPRREALPRFDPASDSRRDYLAQSLPASGPEIPWVNCSGLQARELSDSLAVDDTVPLPVIAADIPPASVPPASGSLPSGPTPSGPTPPGLVAAPARAKLDQIKDLYLTAEAIGEDALGRHFDEVSERQRQLIREYFNQAGVGPGSVPGMTSGQATNATLPR
jgi:hypothetical protein